MKVEQTKDLYERWLKERQRSAQVFIGSFGTGLVPVSRRGSNDARWHGETLRASTS